VGLNFLTNNFIGVRIKMGKPTKSIKEKRKEKQEKKNNR